MIAGGPKDTKVIGGLADGDQTHGLRQVQDLIDKRTLRRQQKNTREQNTWFDLGLAEYF